MCGAGISEIAILSSAIASAAILLLNIIPRARAPRILILSYESSEDADREIKNVLSSYTKYFSEKTRTITNGMTNLAIELNISESTSLCRHLSEIPYVHSVSLLEHDGEITY